MTNTSQLKRGFLLLACICIAGIFLAKVSHPARNNLRAPAVMLDQRGIDFAGFLIEDDVNKGLSGSESLLESFSQKQLLQWGGLDAETTAKEYEERYDANEIAADEVYKDKKLLVKGTISTIERDFTGDGYLTLRGTNPFIGVRAELRDSSFSEAASFHRGQPITLICRGAGRVVTIAMLNDCSTLDDYERAIKPTIDDRVRDFLTGHTSLPKNTAYLIGMAYEMGMALPPEFACSQHDASACSKWLKDKASDPVWQKSMRDRIAQLLTTLKVDTN